MDRLLVIIFLLIVTLDVALGQQAAVNQPKLKFVSVVFRHGDRAPDPTEIYPNDPHYNNTFYPVGLGGLTKAGKLREYNLGTLLRLKYKNLLGDVYVPSMIMARSTDYKRTKMCLQLVLSAIFPPKGKQLWNSKLNWQPIPTTYASVDQDWLMIPEECPEYMEERERVENLPEVKAKLESFNGFMKNLTELTGKNMTDIYDMSLLYFILTSESTMGLELPQWTHEIFPKGRLYDAIQLEYEIFSYTNTLKRLNGGKLLHEIIKNIQTAISKSAENSLKLALYSGHETNIVALLQALGVFKPHTPQYGSAVIIELYEMNEQYYVKVLYYLGIPSALTAQRIPGCDILCPLNKFIDLLSEVTPSADELFCKKKKKYVGPNSL